MATFPVDLATYANRMRSSFTDSAVYNMEIKAEEFDYISLHISVKMY